ncbi:hypothetical protein K1X76_06300 [bacterium]|nr:hypothetical protein [bacterium]
MDYRHLSKVVFLLIPLFITSCFGGVDQRGSVKGFKHGLVQTEGGSFRVGKLGSNWKKDSFNYRAILFKNTQREASISVSSFCKQSFDDGPLETLARQTSYGMTEEKVRQLNAITVAGRDALRRVVQGKVDGLTVVLDTVTLKMNQCVFDFVYVSDPDSYALGTDDFEIFYSGFAYIQGPR